MDILFATHNKNKLREVRQILSGYNIIGLDAFPNVPEAPEPFPTFVGNAKGKALWAYDHTGLWSVAEDSGLEVKALGGRPGVYSKRYTEEQTSWANNAKLLRELEGVKDRRARFITVVAVYGPKGFATATGILNGYIAYAPMGNKGFGYDPLFIPDEIPDKTLAQISAGAKNRISHRARAFRKIPTLLAKAGIS